MSELVDDFLSDKISFAMFGFVKVHFGINHKKYIKGFYFIFP